MHKITFWETPIGFLWDLNLIYSVSISTGALQ